MKSHPVKECLISLEQSLLQKKQMKFLSYALELSLQPNFADRKIHSNYISYTQQIAVRTESVEHFNLTGKELTSTGPKIGH